MSTLYVVATPLGNLGDLSLRAREVLREVDVVAAEDTRRTQRLLASIDAHPRLLSWHAHSTAGRLDTLLTLLGEGKSMALVTDAGTPAISDPGSDLVQAARRIGCDVVPIPGPSSVTTALSVSGLAADRYVFVGFLPRKGVARRRLLDRIAHEPWTVVLFEAPGRVADLLGDLIEWCGRDRPAVVTRELTKLHEEIRAASLGELVEWVVDHPPRGEVTLVVAGVERDPAPPPPVDVEPMTNAIAAALEAGDSRKDVVQMLTARYGLSRNEAYKLVNASR